MLLITRLFWFSIGTILYTYLGYPILVTLLAKVRGRPHLTAPITPSVTLVLAAYNEASIIEDKIRNSLALDYPKDKLKIVVMEDGSDDDTVAIAAAFDGVTVIHHPDRLGKAKATQQAIPQIDSEIIVLSDANAMLAPGSLKAITRHFVDPTVGGVSGEKQVLGGGEGLYWRYESFLKQKDSQLSSVMGAAGELFAIRRSAYEPPPADTIIEDFMISMGLVSRGWRFVYEPDAIAREQPLDSIYGDWQRRTRNSAGGIQAISHLPELLQPDQGIVAWQYFSHRFLRWAVTPWLLPIAFVLNLMLWPRKFYRILLSAQLLFYGTGLIGYLRNQPDARKPTGSFKNISFMIAFFCMANLAAIVGFWRFVTGQQPASWKKVR